MNLFYRIFFISFLPLLTLGIVMVYQISELHTKQLAEYANQLQKEQSFIESRLSDVIENIQTQTSVIASSPNVVTGFEQNDNDVLFQWGKLFLGATLDKVKFVDTSGLVLARAHDEFVFSDFVLMYERVWKKCKKEVCLRFLEVDGKMGITAITPVRRYGEKIIGYVVTSKHLDGRFLNDMSQSTDWKLKVSVLEPNVPTIANKIYFTQLQGILEEFFYVLPKENRVPSYIGDIQKYLMNSLVLSVIALSFLLGGFLFLHLSPYEKFSKILQKYQNRDASLEVISEELQTLSKKYSSHEIVSVSKQVSDMAQIAAQTERTLEKLTITDALTQAYNRMKLDEVLDEALYRFERYDETFSVILMDVDHFKKVNDTYGHLIGDTVLKELVNIIKSHIRQSDIFGRWGGEEFMIVCSRTSIEGARELAFHIKKVIASFQFSEVGHVTVSMGLSQIKKGDEKNHLIHRADSAMYEAKGSGRNCVKENL